MGSIVRLNLVILIIVREKMKIIIFLALISLLLCCSAPTYVTIKAIVGKTETEKKFLDDITEFRIGKFQGYYNKITGLDQLKSLKKIELDYLPSDVDLSFLNNLSSLEVLIMVSFDLKTLDFLNNLKNLRAIYFDSMSIAANEIDLKANKKLEYFGFIGSHFTPIDKNEWFEPKLHLKNIPASLKFIDCHYSPGLPIDKETLENLKNVPHVILDSRVKEENSDIIGNYHNLIFIDNEDEITILPSEFQMQEFNKKIKNGFF